MVGVGNIEDLETGAVLPVLGPERCLCFSAGVLIFVK